MKSFKDYIAEEHPTWHVTFKTGHKPQKVKGRNTAEAIRKAEKRAQKSGEKDPRLTAMYKGIKKVSEEVEQVEEAYRKPTPAEIAKDKERERKASGKKRPSMDHKSASKKMYGNMMGGLKEEEQIDEILDTPKAMQSYKNKAKASHDKAASSAAAKILRGRDKDGNRADHRPELKTMAKRKKGMTAADMVAVRRTFDNLRKEDLDESDIAEILRQYALSENVNADQLAELTEEEINEIIGKAIGGAFKVAAKTAVGAGRLAKKAAVNKQGNMRLSTAGRRDALKKKVEKERQREKDRKEIESLKKEREKLRQQSNK